MKNAWLGLCSRKQTAHTDDLGHGKRMYGTNQNVQEDLRVQRQEVCHGDRARLCPGERRVDLVVVLLLLLLLDVAVQGNDDHRRRTRNQLDKGGAQQLGRVHLAARTLAH